MVISATPSAPTSMATRIVGRDAMASEKPVGDRTKR
jgi:hypothetical protein